MIKGFKLAESKTKAKIILITNKIDINYIKSTN